MRLPASVGSQAKEPLTDILQDPTNMLSTRGQVKSRVG